MGEEGKGEERKGEVGKGGRGGRKKGKGEWRKGRRKRSRKWRENAIMHLAVPGDISLQRELGKNMLRCFMHVMACVACDSLSLQMKKRRDLNACSE